MSFFHSSLQLLTQNPPSSCCLSDAWAFSLFVPLSLFLSWPAAFLTLAPFPLPPRVNLFCTLWTPVGFLNESKKIYDHVCPFSDHLSGFLAPLGLQVCRIMQTGKSGGRGCSQVGKEKPLLKCHAKGGEVQEPGPGMREMDQNQEIGQSEAQLSECQKMECGGRVSWKVVGLWLSCFL